MGRIWTLAAALMVAGAVSAIGNTYTWDGTTNNWNTTNHWIGSVLPSAGDTGIVNSGVAQMNAALTGSPTIVVNAGGTAVATASIAVTNLVLNGGKLRINGYGVVLGGTLNVQTDSWFQFESGGSQGYKGLLSGAGGVSITNTGGSTMNGGNYFSNNSSTGYTGNVHIYGSSGFHVRLDNSWALGSNNTVYVESNGTLAVNNANISRPVTLNGGTLALVANCYLYGTLTVTAPSVLLGHYAMGGVYGQIVSPYVLTLYGATGANTGLRFKNVANASTWTGGFDIAQYWAYVESAGSQGGGPINIRAGTQLCTGPGGGYDFTGANAFTNDLSGSGAFDLRAADWGSTRQKIEMKGNSITPGGNGTVGTLTVNASSLTLTNNGSANATLKIDVSSGSTYDVLKFDPLGYAPQAMTLNNAVLQVSLFSGLTIPGPSTKLFIIRNASTNAIRGLFIGLTNNATIDFGGGTNCQITYTADFDGDGKSNDVALYNFYAPQQPVAPAVDNGAGVTNLLSSSCYLSGNVSQGTPAPDVYVCYGATSAGLGTSAWDHVVYVNPYAGAGPFSIRVIQLLPGSNYFYSCFATNGSGGAWSAASSFTTPTAASQTWTNTAWVDNSGLYSWTISGNWSNRLPNCAGDTGYIPNGRTANADGDLGTSGDRPTVVVQSGGRLYTIGNVSETPVVLAGGVFDMNFRNNTFGGPIALVADSSLVSGSTGNPSDHPITATISGGANLTLATVGSQYWQGNSPNLHCRLRLGTGKLGFTDPGALGTGPLTLGAGAQVTWYMDYQNYALILTNDVSGFGVLYANNAAGCTLRGNTVMPGTATNAGVLTVNSPRCLLTNATLAVNIFSNGVCGQLLVTTNGACTLANANLALTLGYKPSPTDQLFILLQSGTNPIVGTFNGLPEGAVTNVPGPNGSMWRTTISYAGNGDGESVGNDVVLYNFVSRSGGLLLMVQ